MNFATAAREERTHTYTENGARAKNTSGDSCLDFFSTIGALRDTDVDRKIRLFENAYNEHPLSALRILFYGRDVRGGLGERETFRQILHHVAKMYPAYVKKNIHLIPFYGRWDDLYSLIYTDCEDDMWKLIGKQFRQDWQIYLNHLKLQDQGEDYEGGISLLAKWVKRGDESSQTAKSLGILTAKRLGYTVYRWKRMVAELRKYIDIVEAKMSTKRWDEINYSTVPSRASLIYRNAFFRHDSDRYGKFLEKVQSGEEKINTGTLYPYDVLSKAFVYDEWCGTRLGEYDSTIQTLWDSLPDYVNGQYNALVIADTSGSMTCSNCRPMYTALSLAIYFAQHNRGPFHNLWMTFSEHPQYQEIKGDNLWSILRSMDMSGWNMNTNLSAALLKILHTCIENNLAPEDVPASLIIISDMEIDDCEHSGWSFYDHMKEVYKEHGYEIPNIVFWNVNSRHDVYHADKSRKGVQLVSGQSASTFLTLMNSIGMTPVEYMRSVIDSERYQLIQL